MCSCCTKIFGSTSCSAMNLQPWFTGSIFYIHGTSVVDPHCCKCGFVSSFLSPWGPGSTEPNQCGSGSWSDFPKKFRFYMKIFFKENQVNLLILVNFSCSRIRTRIPDPGQPKQCGFGSSTLYLWYKYHFQKLHQYNLTAPFLFSIFLSVYRATPWTMESWSPRGCGEHELA